VAIERFQLIEEKSLGRLSPRLYKKWQVLMARKERLELAQAKLKANLETFELEVAKSAGKKFTADVHQGFKLESNGTLTQIFCKCVNCQAKLHGMSLLTTVESMIKSGLIPRDQIASLRSHVYNDIVAPKEREIFS